MILNHLISMGGYGAFVWPAYFITLAVFGLNIILTLKEKRHIIKKLKLRLSYESETKT
jgi:heme exporter protein CcmD